MTPDASDGPRLDHHRAVVPGLLDGLRAGDAESSTAAGRRAEVARRVKALEPEQRASAAIVLLGFVGYATRDLMPTLRALWRTVDIDRLDDLALVLHVAVRTQEPYESATQRLPLVERAVVDAVDRLGEPARELLDQQLHALLGAAERTDRLWLVAEVRRDRFALFRAAQSGDPLARILPADDGWAEAVHRQVAALDADERAVVVGALEVLATVPSGPRPTKTWIRAARAAAASSAAIGPLVHDLLVALTGLATRREEHDVEDLHWVTEDWLAPTSEPLARGLAWAAVWRDPPDAAVVEAVAIAAARRTASGPAAPTVVSSAVNALATLPVDEAVAALGRIDAKLRHKSLRTQLERTLRTLATDAGMTAAALRERNVPTVGFAPDSTRDLPVGDHTATLSVDDRGRVAVGYVDGDGNPVRSLPTSAKEEQATEVAEVARARKEAQATLTAERTRLEDLLATDRRWRAGEWRRWYLEHPLVGPMARRLIWTVTASDRARTVLPELDGTDARTIPDEAEVALWHPCEHPAGDVRAWRDRLLAASLRQPFKQAYREVYLLTPAETATRSYTNRFAGHVVRAGQLRALVSERRWSMPALGYFDDGWSVTAARHLEEERITARLHVDAVEPGPDDDGYGLAPLATTDQLAFARGERGLDTVVDLVDVPPRAFSEVLRDVDLFVSIASVAMDPTWLDHGDVRFHPYWRSTADRALGPAGDSRREVLAALLPRLRIADRCTLEGRSLVVRGDRRTYRIHLGSANVRMEPNDEYLCIVPARNPRLPSKVFLPFDDDPVLSLVLSKALLLADDASIDDPLISGQIDGRR